MKLIQGFLHEVKDNISTTTTIGKRHVDKIQKRTFWFLYHITYFSFRILGTSGPVTYIALSLCLHRHVLHLVFVRQVP